MTVQAKFVTAPTLSATTRLSLTTGPLDIKAENFSLGVPTLTGDPGSPGVEYGYRRLTLNVSVDGTQPTAGPALSALALELNRPNNWLFFQLSPLHKPVWFRTYATQQGELDFANVYSNPQLPDHWVLPVQLDADAWAYGALETITTGEVINFDPAAGSNPTKYAVPVAVKGDAVTPAIVALTWSNDRHGYQHLLAAARSTDYLWQVGGTDGWTPGADTGASAASASFSGGTYRAVTFAGTPGMATRLSGAAPAPIASGRYRVLIRVSRTAATATFALRLGQLIRLSTYGYGPTVATVTWPTSGANHAAWVDLGVHQFPFGYTKGVSENYTPNIAIDAQRLSGSGDLRLDCIKLIPADGTSLYVDHPNFGPTGALTGEVHDGLDELIYMRSLTGPDTAESSIPAGGFLTLAPGAGNVIHLLSQTSPLRASNFWQDAPDVITQTAAMTLSYYPLYLNIRGD